MTFLHGDWKMGNLGMHPDGRTILIDWAYPGSGPVLWDLAWYLALNCARLPMSKEATIDALRAALERHGVSTDGWFELQLDLCLLGMAACFGGRRPWVMPKSWRGGKPARLQVRGMSPRTIRCRRGEEFRSQVLKSATVVPISPGPRETSEEDDAVTSRSYLVA